MKDNVKKFQKKSEALDFIVGDNSLFTIKNIKTGNRLTYRVKRPKKIIDQNKELYFVEVLNSENSYEYIGCMQLNQTNNLYFFKLTKKSPRPLDDAGVKPIQWLIKYLQTDGNELHPSLEIWHHGMCGKCGRELTVPESIKVGFGPHCYKLVKPQVEAELKSKLKNLSKEQIETLQ
jgi:hypothetical protein